MIPDPDPAPLLGLLAAGRAAAARAARCEPFWAAAVAADPRLARLRDDPAARDEIEGRLLAWEHAHADRPWRRDRTKAEVGAAIARIRAAQDELADLADEMRAVAGLAKEGDLGHHATVAFLALLEAADAVAPAVEAAEAIAALPARRGGRNAFTADFRPDPVREFGAAMVPVLRAHGLPLGGKRSRDPALAALIDAAHVFATGAPVPGRAALLAELRKR